MIREILSMGAQKYGIPMPESVVQAFIRYFEFLKEKNKIMNLTAITDEKEAAELHFLDSLALVKHDVFIDKSVIDIGSGAGFPGIPMKLSEPSLSLTLLDAQQKRVDFLKELCWELGLPDVNCMHARAEEAAHRPDMRDMFDFAVSRAVAKLNILCELCLPLVKPGGAFISMKSTDSEAEIHEAQSVAKKLGAEIEKSVDYEIPGAGVSHRLVFVRKKAATPDGYPRRYARILKKSL